MNNRYFKGVWFPKDIWLNEELTWTEKICLVEIDSLEGSEGCFASNYHFATFLGVSEKTIANAISRLKALCYIKVEGRKGDRRIFIDKTKLTRVGEVKAHFPENREEFSQKSGSTLYCINNTKNNTTAVEEGAGSNAHSVYRKFFFQPLNIYNQERLMNIVDDLEVFEEVMEIWAGRQYQETNITGIINLFNRLVAERKVGNTSQTCEKCISGWIETEGGLVRCQH